ncbi:hypothetical protein ABS768_06170 [Flavobacterium sp. ST-75]|uniref:Uncharacterized protein n=1 Tax=Flavobacterium rhizophilum TaxID=3163296 RepID=A0ABW8YCZ4_9FLAO
MRKDRIKPFIKNNIAALLIGLAVFALFLKYTFEGNKLCDCQKTEKYNSASGGTHSRAAGVNHFYHK